MILLLIAVLLLVVVIAGAPFVPAHRADLEELLDELGNGAGRVFIDLGSGDGRVLAAARRRGFNPVGYELNPILWLISAVKLRSLRAVRLWPWQLANLGVVDVIYIFSTSLHLKYIHRPRFPANATVVIYGPQPSDWSQQSSMTVGSSVIYPPVAQNAENKLP